MSNRSEKYIRDVAIQSDIPPCALVGQNAPAQYISRQYQYYAKRTQKFIQERARYASDFVQAFVQGICPNDFYKFISTYIRLSDIASLSASSTKNIDDVKVILFADEKINYFPIGAKLETMGSTWLCTNPANISGVNGVAVVQRCNAAYCLYDYYGNIVTEPIVVEKRLMSGNDNETPQTLVLMDGYFNVICQLNEYTRQLGQSKRLILGSKAYHITGFTDFIQEFTGEYDSVHILQFTVRIEEPTVDDDLENHIENGHNYSFTATIDGAEKLTVGAQSTLAATFVKNGVAVSPTEKYPQTWIWSSSDDTIATVDASGTVTAKSAGNVQIKAVLKECGRVSATVDLVIEEAQTRPYIAFNGVVPSVITQYSSATFGAGYYENGVLSEDVKVEWSFSGADEGAYLTVANGNTITITCLRSDSTPLTVKASYGEVENSVEIRLEAY